MTSQSGLSRGHRSPARCRRWGRNQYGQLGDGTTTSRKKPVQIASDVAIVSAGVFHSLFIKTDGTLWAMGKNDNGQLGDGTTINKNIPVKIASEAVQIAAGTSHSLFLQKDETLWGMGWNEEGQLGNNRILNSRPSKVATGVARVSAGGSFTLFVKKDGSLWGTGLNSYGQLGDGTTDNRKTPVKIADYVVQVSCGCSHSLFLKRDKTLWAMGSNYSNQLGHDMIEASSTPVQVASGVEQLAAGGSHSLFVDKNAVLHAMGSNFVGQLGDGTTTDIDKPRQIQKIEKPKIKIVKKRNNYHDYHIDKCLLIDLSFYKDGRGNPWKQNTNYQNIQSTKINAESMEKWKETLGKKDIASIEFYTHDWMRRLGYEPMFTPQELHKIGIDQYRRFKINNLAKWIQPFAFDSDKDRLTNEFIKEKLRLTPGLDLPRSDRFALHLKWW